MTSSVLESTHAKRSSTTCESFRELRAYQKWRPNKRTVDRVLYTIAFMGMCATLLSL